MQLANRAHISKLDFQIETDVMAESAAMDVDGLTKDYSSSQLQTGDMLLPEPFLMTANDVEKLLCLGLFLCCSKTWQLSGF